MNNQNIYLTTSLASAQKRYHWPSPYIRQTNHNHPLKGQIIMSAAISIAHQANSLITCFLYFFPTYFCKQAEEFNALFIFWVTLFIFREKNNPSSAKNTQDSMLYIKEIMNYKERVNGGDHLQKIVQNLINDIINQWIEFKVGGLHISKLSYMQKKKTLKSYFQKKITKICQQSQDLQFLVPEQFRKSQKNVKGYLKFNLQEMYKVQWLKSIHRSLRLTNFIFISSNYFQTFALKQMSRVSTFYFGNNNTHLLEDGPVKITLEDLINSRSKDEDYSVDNRMLIENLYKILSEYYESVTDKQGQHLHYRHLHPKFIIYDQLALSIKLSQHPLVLQALGVIEEPMSTQARLVFQATPKSPAHQCLTPPQIQQKSYYCDSFYGESWWYGRQYMPNQAELEVDRKKRARMEEQNIYWKFLHTVYFILNGEYYNSHIQIEKQYEKSIIAAKTQLESDPESITNFINLNEIKIPSSISFVFEQLGSILDVNHDDDSVINNLGLLKTEHQMSFYLNIKDQVKELLKENLFLYRYHNVKAYFLIALLEATSSLHFILTAYSTEKIHAGASESIRKLPNMILMLNSAEAAMQAFQKKCKEYLGRSDKDKNRGYLESTSGQQLKDKITDIFKQYDALLKSQAQLDLQIQNIGLYKCKETIIQFTALVKKLYLETATLSDHCFQKLVKPLPKQNQPEVERNKNQYKLLRCQLLTKCLRVCRPSNWMKLKTLICSQLPIDESVTQVGVYEKFRPLLAQCLEVLKAEEQEIGSLINSI